MRIPQTQAHALVLTAPEESQYLNEKLTDTIAGLIAKHAIVDARWLCPREAWQLRFVSGTEQRNTILEQATRLLGKHPIDVNIVPDEGENRRKKLLIADMDSTIIEQECIDEIADYAGVRDRVADITERAMRGELEFAEALKTRVSLLGGLDETLLDEIIEKRITIMPGAKTLVATMKANGARASLVSGGFTYFTQRIGEFVGFDTNQANRLAVSEGKLTGDVIPPILGRDAKREALLQHARELRIELNETLAVGDGANDLAMLSEAGLGVAYRAKPIVADQAKFSIRHGNLKALLYLQGYAREEFAD